MMNPKYHFAQTDLKPPEPGAPPAPGDCWRAGCGDDGRAHPGRGARVTPAAPARRHPLASRWCLFPGGALRCPVATGASQRIPPTSPK